jgi:hypothetical protein
VCLSIRFAGIAFSAKHLQIGSDCQAAFGQRFDVVNGEIVCPGASAAPGLLFSKRFADLSPLVIVATLCACGSGGLFDSFVDAIAFIASSCACNGSAVFAWSRKCHRNP